MKPGFSHIHTGILLNINGYIAKFAKPVASVFHGVERISRQSGLDKYFYNKV